MCLRGWKATFNYREASGVLKSLTIHLLTLPKSFIYHKHRKATPQFPLQNPKLVTLFAILTNTIYMLRSGFYFNSLEYYHIV